MTNVIPAPVMGSEQLPAKADVVVIGGGIIGISTALYLAERNLSVVVCEKGLVAAEQSSRNWGWVRQMGRDKAEIPLAVQSRKLWEDINAYCGEETGYRTTGVTYLCRNQEQLQGYERWLEHARGYGLDSELLTSSQLKQQLPPFSEPFVGALHTPSDGRAEPLLAAPALARAALRKGVHIVLGCAARSLDKSGGKLSGVITERGRVECSSVVVAGGAWSRLFLGNAGVEFPQLKVVGNVARVTGVSADAGEMPVGADNFAFRRHLDGSYSIAKRDTNLALITPDSFRLFNAYKKSLAGSRGELSLRFGRQFFTELMAPRHWQPEDITPFEQQRVLDPSPDKRLLEKGLENLKRAVPAFKNARMARQWAGAMDVTPDAVPVVDEVKSQPGLFVASGFSGHGFGTGPAAGQLMAEIVCGSDTTVDRTPFRLDRFTS